MWIQERDSHVDKHLIMNSLNEFNYILIHDFISLIIFFEIVLLLNLI